MIIQNEKDLYQVIDLLNKSEIWTYDLESTGLNVRKDQVIGFSAASDAGSFYIIHKKWDGQSLIELISKEALLPIINILNTKKLVTWNGSYDTRISAHYFGVKMWEQICADSMLQAHTINENRFNYGLKDISAEVFGRDSLEEKQKMLESIKSNGGTPTEFYKASSDLLAQYGKKDAELTWALYKKFDKELERQGLNPFFQSEVMELYRNVTIKMEFEGVPVDVPALEKAQVEISADMLTLEKEIQLAIKPLLANFEDWYISKHFPFKFTSAFKDKLGTKLAPPNWPRTKAGSYSFSKIDLDRAVKKGLDLNCDFYHIGTQSMRPPAELIRQIQLELLAEQGQTYIFNLASTDHLKRLFFVEHKAMLNEQPLSRTELGAPQVNDEFLSKMALKYDWAAKLQVWKGLLKLKGTYIEGVLAKQESGIFYPQFFQHRTVSGRYGSDLQQLPRPYESAEGVDPYLFKYTNLIRTFFIAGPDHTFVDDDYESLEPHIFAHVSGDPALQAIFNKGHDFYSTIAIDTEGLTQYSPDKKAPNYLGKLNKAARQKAKAYALGLAYGMSPYKLAFEINVPQKEAEQLARKYFEAYPALHNWMKWSKKEACEKGQIKTLAGRVRRFPELPRLYAKYGEVLFDSLDLWKKFNETPHDYEVAKKAASKAKNSVNNASNVQIQGYAASIVNKASIQIARELKQLGLTAYICASIHDEIIVRCAETDAAKVCEIVQRNMENCVQLTVKLKAIPSVGINFKEAKGA